MAEGIERFVVARDDEWCQAWPDLAKSETGRLVCVYSQCTTHATNRRDETQIKTRLSEDGGKTWEDGAPVTDVLHRGHSNNAYWNCARISAIRGARLVATFDRIEGRNEGVGGEQDIYLAVSREGGSTWEEPRPTNLRGIVPGKILQLANGRFLLTAHTFYSIHGYAHWQQRLWISDDLYAWQGPFMPGDKTGEMLCEGDLIEFTDGQVVCMMRENSGHGFAARLSASHDGGMSWSVPRRSSLQGCHRPTMGWLYVGSEKKVLVTYRYFPFAGAADCNLFAAVLEPEGLLDDTPAEEKARITPIDYDHHPEADQGYSGWVQDGGHVVVVNYVKDDAPKQYIRCLRVPISELVASEPGARRGLMAGAQGGLSDDVRE